MRSRILVAFVFLVMMQAFFVIPSSEDVPNTDVPIFKLLSVHSSHVQDGVDVELTFKNVGYPATEGTVLIPWERVALNVPLGGILRTGNITEATLGLDVNGDGNTNDIFSVRYVNRTQVKVDGTTAESTEVLGQARQIEDGNLYLYDETKSFLLGTKNHVLYNVWSFYDSYYATFGLDIFLRSHPTPHAVFFVEQTGSSINSAPKAEITSLKINGTLTPYNFKQIVPWFLYIEGGRWYTEYAYIYPFGFIGNNTVFTVQLSIRGEPGSYILSTMLNWSPDTSTIYQYVFDAISEIPFTITGTVKRELTVGDETFHINFLTNSTISDQVVLDSTEKTLSFNATGHYGTVGIFNVTLPQNLLGSNPLSITVDGTPLTNFIQTMNETHTSLSFNLNYPLSTRPAFTISKIVVKAEQAQPLWTQWWLWATLVIVIVIIAVTAFTIRKRRQVKKETTSSLNTPPPTLMHFSSPTRWLIRDSIHH